MGSVPEIASQLTIANGGAINQNSHGIGGDIRFDTTSATTLAGNALTLQGDVQVLRGAHTIASDIFSRGSVFSVASGATLNLTGQLTSSNDQRAGERHSRHHSVCHVQPAAWPDPLGKWPDQRQHAELLQRWLADTWRRSRKPLPQRQSQSVDVRRADRRAQL